MAVSIWKRQGPFSNGDNNNDGTGYGYSGGYGSSGEVNWWWTPAGMATRYGVVAFLFAAILVFFIGGYYHAKSRMRKGLAPLPYHRWMVRRQLYYPQQPRYAYPQDPNGPSYGMEGYPPPPPAYSNAEVPPPVYQPPPGATKAMADQSFGPTNRDGDGSGSGGSSAPVASVHQ